MQISPKGGNWIFEFSTSSMVCDRICRLFVMGSTTYSDSTVQEESRHV